MSGAADPSPQRGLALADQGAWREAIGPLAAALAPHPDRLDVRIVLARCHLMSGDAVAAAAVASHASLFDAREALAAVLAEFAAAGALSERASLIETFLRRHPHDYDAALTLAASSHTLGRPGAALRWSDYALMLRPGERLPREIRATALIDRGDVEAGLAAYRELLREGDAHTAARHLVLMHYDPELDNDAAFTALTEFSHRHVPPFGAPFQAKALPDPMQTLRIGWLSPRLCAGPVATFLHGTLAHFDRAGFRQVLIDLAPVPADADAVRLRALAHETIDASGLDDARLLQRLRDLHLDVLVDLAGHSTANRIAVLAQRVAPVQACWLDWFDTTGITAMDAWISDGWLTPPDSTQRYCEKIVRLPSGRFCYTPPVDAPSPERDIEGDDAVVFASFNRLAKFNASVIKTWAQILHRVPRARLELRARHLGEEGTRAHIAQGFAARGIDASRLMLGAALPYHDLLAAYRHIDIALDPFPFSGCTTSCDALWMGCPVITLPGESYVSRQSASLLWRLQRNEWIAHDSDDYVERAVALAGDVGTLRTQRVILRDAMCVALCDAPAQAHEFAAALRALWRAHCGV